MSAPNSKAFGELLDECVDAAMDAAWAKDSEPATDMRRAVQRSEVARAVVLSYVEGLEKRLWKVVNVAHGAIDHVAAANYVEREAEAHRWVDAAAAPEEKEG